MEIFINKYHDTFLDYLFRGITYLGEGIIPFLIIIIILNRKVYYGIVAGSALITATVIAQVLKRFVFPEALRPKAFLKELDLYFIADLEIHSYFSFPSGHTTGGFTLFTILAIFAKNPYVQFFYFILAFMVGLSRVYLLQHFFIDTYFGAIIGTITAVIVYYFFENYTSLKEKEKLQLPLYKLKS
ncbi:MAG: phosphatase PAP2 family protein [Cytophagaceae bacterium]